MSMPSANAMLDVSGLSVSYGKLSAVRDLTFSLRQAQIVTIIGPNGAGKSTLLKALIGLLPASGGVRFLGEDMERLETEERVERGLFLVPETRELFTDMSVGDNLILGAYCHWGDRAGMADNLDNVFELFPRLKERRQQMAATLSGGERQMLALGRALMGRPKLLMLDEPSLGLAPLIVREIFRIIARLRDQGVTVLLVEQNARAALETADYGYVLETGDIVHQGEAKALLADPRVLETYLGGSAGSKTAS
jgi:branched-chain amino acid transport system ATP-binding protein